MFYYSCNCLLYLTKINFSLCPHVKKKVQFYEQNVLFYEMMITQMKMANVTGNLSLSSFL